MRKILKVLVVTLMFSFLIMPFCVVPQPKDAVQAREASPELSIKADSPFNITANADFDLYDSGGNGQPGTPWILENYVINASGLGVHGILINNTDAHFILRNCTVTGTETGYAGIWSENITNGIIQNNTIVNNYYGIYLVRSSDNEITDNNASYNTGTGLILTQSDHNTITNNTLAHSTNYHGMHLTSSNNNTLTGNTANDNDDHGIYLDFLCNYNMLTDNTANDNTVTGIALFSVLSNTLTANTANGNDGDGFELRGDDFTVVANTAMNNGQSGFHLDMTYNSVFSNNTASNNTADGLFMENDCCDNTLTFNYFMNNAQYGAYVGFIVAMDTSYRNNFTRNIIVCNTDFGVYLQKAGNTEFHGNLIIENKDGTQGNQVDDWGGGTVWVGNDFDGSLDFDGDGLLNYWEIYWNADPLRVDTDGDTVIDPAEVIYGTDPSNEDTDADGLDDPAEIYTYPTSATNPDTDGDGLNDSAEIFMYPTNPTNPDTDGDGLNDSAELYIYPTNATNPDTDADVMPDGWEIYNFLDPMNETDALDDFDLDDLINLGEYLNGTNPNNIDTDGDGLNDSAEVFLYNTDGNNSDTDADFMPDAWEVSKGTNPVVQDAFADYDIDSLINIFEYSYGTDPQAFDTDGDGHSDGAEVVAGTDPLDQNDFPTQMPDNSLIWISILIGGIIIAAAIVIHGLLQRSRPVVSPPAPQKKAPPTPEKPPKES